MPSQDPATAAAATDVANTEAATRQDVDGNGKGMVSTMRHTNFEGMNARHAAAGGKGLLPTSQYQVEEVRMDVSEHGTDSEVAMRQDMDGKGIVSTLRDTSFEGMNVRHAAAGGKGLLPMSQYQVEKVKMDINKRDIDSGMQVVVIPAKDSHEQSEEAREEVYHALSPHRRLLWHLYFYTVAMSTALLIFRPPDIMFSISVETTVVFALVTMLYYGLVLHSSIWVTPLWVSGLDQWARGMGMWYFTACWMIFYTINIPPPLYEPRHMVITCFFLVLTLAIKLLSKVSRFAFLFGQRW